MTEHDELIRMQERWKMMKSYIEVMKIFEGYDQYTIDNLIIFMGKLEAPADAKPVIHCENCGGIVKHEGEHLNEIYTELDGGGWECEAKPDCKKCGLELYACTCEPPDRDEATPGVDL